MFKNPYDFYTYFLNNLNQLFSVLFTKFDNYFIINYPL